MFKKILPIAIVAVLTTGCAIKSSRSVVLFDGSKTDYSKIDKMKKGKACRTAVLGIPTSQDSTVLTAAKNGRVSKVMHVDQTFEKGFLNLTEDRCTVVYGN